MKPLVITLTGNCTHQHIGRYWRQYRSAFGQSDTVDVAFSHITAMDSALVALLVDWAARAQKQQITLRFINPPNRLQQLITVNAAEDLLPHCSGIQHA